MNKLKYMKTWMSVLALIAIFTFSNNTVKASHIAGADVSYKCLGGDTFKITVNVFRDCSGISAPTTIDNSVTITSSCGNVNAAFTLTNPNSTLSNANNGSQVSQLCGTALPQSACSGGPYPGMMQLIFEAIVVLPPCADWKIGFAVVCCRNTNVNLTGSGNAFVEATLNNLVDTCNTGPTFEAQPIPYVCAGQQVNYNFGATEPDGDSLAYSFFAGWSTSGVPNTFQAPYTATQPIAGITINPKTGEVIFTPLFTGNFVVVVKVEEYNANGALISTIMRDILFIVQICFNQQPNPVAPIVAFSGTGALVDSNSVEVCVGESFTFDVKIWDPNPNDSVSLYSNIDSILPGATHTVTYPNAPTSYDTAVVTISWSAVPVPGLFYPFFISANDNACPIPGIFYATYDVRIVNSTFAWPNQIICKNTQMADLNVKGGDRFVWNAISGNPIVVGPLGVGNFSCDTCQYPKAYPSQTTCYEVTSNLSGSCNNVDTICVYVAPNFQLAITNDTLICSVEPIQLNVTPDKTNQVYSYTWDPIRFMQGPKISSPVVNPESSTTYYVTVTSDSGCVKFDTVTVDLSPPFPKENFITASDTIICLQDTVNLSVTLGDVTPTKCGLSQNICVGNSSLVQVGTGTNSNSFTTSTFSNAGYPSPFANSDNSSKQQYLYKASDLKAAGLTGGTINALSFNIISQGGSTVYNGYTIKMTCTNNTKMISGSWIGGMQQVFTPKPIFTSPGWNTLPFDNSFDWDGKSNLVVEICFDNGGTNSLSAVTQYDNTTYPATCFIGSKNANVCNAFQQHQASPVNRVPNIRFNICSGVDPNGYIFNWLNPVNLVSPSVSANQAIDMGVNLTTPTKYSVAVADSFGVCFDTLAVNIHVVSQYDATPDSAGPFCITSPYNFMTAFTPGGVWSGPGIVDDTLGLFNPGPTISNGSGYGTHDIIYSITGDICANSDTIQVYVIPPPDASIRTTGPFCELDTAIQIIGVTNGFISSTNTAISNAITDSSGTINLSLIHKGLDSLAIKWTAIGQACNNDSIYTFDLSPQYDPIITSPESYCPHDSIIEFDQFDQDNITSKVYYGQWSGAGIVDSDKGLFDPRTFADSTNGYTAVVTLDSVGACGNTVTLQIQIDTLPDIWFKFTEGDEGPYCKNDGSTVTWEAHPLDDAAFNGIGIESFVGDWLGIGTTIAGFSTNNPIPKAGLHEYVYHFTDLNGCINQDTLRFDIGASPQDPIGSVTNFCAANFIEGLSLDTSSSTNDTNNAFVWYSNSNLTDSVAEGLSYSPNTIAIGNVTYYVQQISPQGCKSIGYGIVEGNIIASPDVEFVVNDVRGIEPFTVDFNNITNQQSTPPAVSWEWGVYGGIFGNSIDAGTDEQFSYEFSYDATNDPAVGDSGYAQYIVLLKGINEFGCEDTFKLRIIVDAISELIIPNIFTPNGDGVNDAFSPTVDGMSAYEGRIYNRWGRKVADLDLANPSWDGVDPQNQQINDGVYYYVITAQGNNGQDYDEKGTVTLIKGN